MGKAKQKIQPKKKGGSAIVSLSSEANAASVIEKYSKNFGEVDIVELLAEVGKATKELKRGNLDQIDEMLFSQAKALESIFSRLSRVAVDSTFNEHMELYLRLALKAQVQCTRTLATLANIKNPSNVSFVKQANIGSNVQVNNTCAPSQQSQEKNQDYTNELLEHRNEQRLDSGEKSEAIKINTRMEAMDKVNRA